MSAQHTPGPWKIEAPNVMSCSRCWYVYRDTGLNGEREYLLNKRKRIAYFLSEKGARAAIAKATGSAS